MFYSRIKSQFGDLVAGISHEAKISGLWFEGQKYFPKITEASNWITETSCPDKSVCDVLTRLIDQLRQYERGDLQVFDLPLDPIGTNFRQIVWEELLQVQYGETTTYGAIGKRVAVKLGRSSMAGQAIGGAVGHNPISIVIPCHRVVAKNGSLTGFAGGLDKKEALLIHERKKTLL